MHSVERPDVTQPPADRHVSPWKLWIRPAVWGLLLAGLVGYAGLLGYIRWFSPTTTAGIGPALLLTQQQTGGIGFNLDELVVDREEIFRGGPPKDGIPALTNPRYVRADHARHVRPGDRVIGVAFGDQARAYPLTILNYHEIVNDTVGGVPLAVTYCPLCDSAAAFDRRTPLGEREFGVSGLLYNSNVLMYDRGGRPESLWSQVKAGGISGPAAQQELEALPLELTTWKDWSERNPHTLVLSDETGHRRDYRRNPYVRYFNQPGLMFPAKPSSDALPAKARVLGVRTDQAMRAYPESAFTGDRTRVSEQIAGKNITVQFDPESRSLRVVEADEGVDWMYSFWFAWYAFYPETSVYDPGSKDTAAD